MEAEITPKPSDAERRAILAALATAERPPDSYTSVWRAAALEDLGDGTVAQQRGSDPGVVEP